MIKVSVIIPVYNAEKYLEECLKSVISQSLKEIEVICVDDGSTDASPGILSMYMEKDNRIKLIKGGHKGGGAARNTGMKHAKGEYLSFLDADDYMDGQMLEKLYDKSCQTSADITVCAVKFLFQATGAIRDDDDSGLLIWNLPEKEVFCYKDMPNSIFNTFHNWPWNKMFRREFVQNHSLQFQELFRTNDLLFVNKAIMEAERITTVQEHLITYRDDPEGDNCQSTNSVQLYGFYEAFQALKDYLEKKGLYEEVKQSFVNHALDGCIANLRMAEFGSSHQELFGRLKDEIFDALDIKDQVDEFYNTFNHESKNLERYRKMQQGDYMSFVLYLAEELRISYRDMQYEAYYRDRKVGPLEREVYDLKIAVRSVAEFYEDEVELIYDSLSFRFGHKATKIPRWLNHKIKGKE